MMKFPENWSLLVLYNDKGAISVCRLLGILNKVYTNYWI